MPENKSLYRTLGSSPSTHFVTYYSVLSMTLRYMYITSFPQCKVSNIFSWLCLMTGPPWLTYSQNTSMLYCVKLFSVKSVCFRIDKLLRLLDSNKKTCIFSDVTRLTCWLLTVYLLQNCKLNSNFQYVDFF